MGPLSEDDGSSIPAWEVSKENVKPLARGRNVETLEAALKQNPMTKVALTDPLPPAAEDEAEDPLQECYDYVLSIEESHPTGAPELTTILEQMTKRFQDVQRYRNDERYLKLWLTYADQLRDPTIVHSFLHTNCIGAELPLFYEAWALIFEERGRLKDADELYLIGCARFPGHEALKSKHRQFECRVTELCARHQEQREEVSRRGGRERRPPRSAGSIAAKSDFQVFNDENAITPSPSSSSSRTSITNAESTRASFRSLASHKAVRKENTPRTERWNERPLPAGGLPGAATPTQRPVQVFIDEAERHQLVAVAATMHRARKRLQERKRVNRFLR